MCSKNGLVAKKNGYHFLGGGVRTQSDKYHFFFLTLPLDPLLMSGLWFAASWYVYCIIVSDPIMDWLDHIQVNFNVCSDFSGDAKINPQGIE